MHMLRLGLAKTLWRAANLITRPCSVNLFRDEPKFKSINPAVNKEIIGLSASVDENLWPAGTFLKFYFS